VRYLVEDDPMAESSPFAFPNEAGQKRTIMRALPTGTVTLLFSDVEGSTLLLQQLGERYASVLSECRDLLRTAFSEHHGHEVDTQGDGFFVVFARATDAIAAVVAIQRALLAHTWQNGAAVSVRIGLHTGEPTRTAEGYIGLDVHHAARIMSVGHGGQVLLSQTTHELVKHKLPDRVSLRDLGKHRLKDLQRPAHHCRPARRFPTPQNTRQQLQQLANPTHFANRTREGTGGIVTPPAA
jgi:class 3 adenylate cyclase